MACSVHTDLCLVERALLFRRNTLIIVVVYLAVASMNDLALVASRVIRWASTWNRPILSAVMMVCVAFPCQENKAVLAGVP